MANDPNIKFITVGEFKTQIGANKLSIVKNPNTGKLFVQADNGQNFRCKATIDTTKPMSVLIPEAGITDACLVNGSDVNVLATL